VLATIAFAAAVIISAGVAALGSWALLLLVLHLTAPSARRVQTHGASAGLRVRLAAFGHRAIRRLPLRFESFLTRR